ncbi:hypothetical protein BFF78_13405 [Streptomyces fodineus]|uniref:Uncharacterized protein n=1 Tax=Streptomyces fodineus TaxID=1904616 RepID=A0A1D7Y8G5_9ACTN|nr:hypothetical protein [Streptomyces fodineus]AOR31913.1 hypothetical protein BFF78_13405 [Streptomyces fodineus]
MAAAFLCGRLFFDDHWPWAVLTVYVKAGGNRRRTDVPRKGVERFAGASLGRSWPPAWRRRASPAGRR